MENAPRYYWLSCVCFDPIRRIGKEPHIVDEVLRDCHPFEWIVNYNTGDPESLHDACRDQYHLLNWKEITEAEYNHYNTLQQ